MLFSRKCWRVWSCQPNISAEVQRQRTWPAKNALAFVALRIGSSFCSARLHHEDIRRRGHLDELGRVAMLAARIHGIVTLSAVTHNKIISKTDTKIQKVTSHEEPVGPAVLHSRFDPGPLVVRHRFVLHTQRSEDRVAQ